MKKIACGLLILLLFFGFILYTPDKNIEKLKEIYTDEESKFVQIQGMDVHYKIEGEGMPLLLLHGTGSSLHTWDDWAAIMDDSFKIVRLDLPAYGLTGPRPDRDYRISGYISFLSEFVKSINLDSFHIAGNSFGGELAFIYAAQHPNKVGKLVLLDPAGIERNDSVEPPMIFKLAQNPFMSLILKKVTPVYFVKNNILEVFSNDAMVTDVMVKRYHDMATRKGNREAFVDRINSPFEPTQKYLSLLEEPTLIMWGEDDEWIPFEDAAIMDLLIPNSRVVSYPNVGHIPMEEYPIQSAADAMIFLNN